MVVNKYKNKIFYYASFNTRVSSENKNFLGDRYILGKTKLYKYILKSKYKINLINIRTVGVKEIIKLLYFIKHSFSLTIILIVIL